VKKFLLCGFSAFLLAASGASGHAPRPKAPSAHPAQAASTAAKIDPAKEADIRRLLEVTGAKTLVEQSMAEMSKSLKPTLANSLPPGDYREKLIDLFFAKFLAKATPQTLLDMAVPSYDKAFSHEEIRGLLQFYQTPLGKKSVSVMPQLILELQTTGRKWGEELGRQSMMEVIAEHPELEKQIEEAQKAAQSGH
jgi:hypothetical protein